MHLYNNKKPVNHSQKEFHRVQNNGKASSELPFPILLFL